MASHLLYENTNGMPMSNGRNLHMQTAHGEVANRVITVGAFSRAEKIASMFDASPAPVRVSSNRGFLTITGYYQGTHVSVVGIGMGVAMMDFFVREVRTVVSGPMAVIRFGTCGGISETAKPGSIVVASQGSSLVSRNYDCFSPDDADSSREYYHICKLSPADAKLSNLLFNEMGNLVGTDNVLEGINVSADSFYSSQNRIDPNFDDHNHDVIRQVHRVYPTASSMEMETFTLLHLSACSKLKIHASSAAIVLSNRLYSAILEEDIFENLELTGCRAVLNAIVAFQF